MYYFCLFPRISSDNEMRYNDSGEMAAVIKHKVEDGKLIVDMQCKDIICRSVYVKQ